MRRYTNLFVLAGVIFLFLGCEQLGLMGPKAKKAAPKPPIGVTVVARVGDFYITADDLNREIEANNTLATQQGMPQFKIDTRDKKIAYLRDQLVRRYMLFQEALDRGLDRNEDIAKTLEYAKMDLLVRKLVSDELAKIDVANGEVEDFYNQNKDALKEPEQRKILEIVAATEDDARQAYSELLKPGADFASVARQLSKADTASKGGDLGFVALEPDPKRRVRFDKFYEVAFSPSLEAGDISNIFKGTDGKFYIIKVENIKKSQARPLSELKENIKNFILSQKQDKAMTDLANKLSGQTKIEVYEGKVD